MNHQFGLRLRQLREEHKLLQRELEKELSLGPGVLSQYERGLREPGFYMLLALADYFDVSTDYLLGRPLARREAPALQEARDRLAQLLKQHPPSRVPLSKRFQALMALAEKASPELFAANRLARKIGLDESSFWANLEKRPVELFLRRLTEYLGACPIQCGLLKVK